MSRYGPSVAVSKALEWDRKYSKDWKPSYGQSSRVDPADLESFCTKVRPFIEDENVKVRSEGKHFNLFCLDKATYDKIAFSLREWVIETTEPKSDKDLEYLLANKAIKVLVNVLPYENYKYKIVIKPTMKYEQRAKLLGWMNKYGTEELRPSTSTMLWLAEHKRYVQDPFLYVASDGMRTLVELYLGPNKSRTEEFVLRSSLEEA